MEDFYPTTEEKAQRNTKAAGRAKRTQPVNSCCQFLPAEYVGEQPATVPPGPMEEHGA